MVAERPEMTSWTDWALRGADARQLLTGHGLASPDKSQSTAGSYSSHIGRQVQELQEKLSASRLALQAQGLKVGGASSRRAARLRKDYRGNVSHSDTPQTTGTGFRESLAASPSNETKVTSPSNETKRSTAASSSERPLSPRYEGQPTSEAIAVWRETQSLNESLGTSSARARRPLTSLPAHGRVPVASSRPHPAAPALSEGEPVTQVLPQPMPPWTSTFGVNFGAGPQPQALQPSSPQSSSQLPPFAEAAMSRLTWLQAEKEALEGWLSSAGYFSVSKGSDDSHGPSSEEVTYPRELLAGLKQLKHESHRVVEEPPGMPEPLQSLQAPSGPEDPWSQLPLRLAVPGRRHERTQHHNYATGHTPSSSVDEGAPSTPSSVRRKSLTQQPSYNNLAAERAAAQAKLEDDFKAIGLERWSDPAPRESKAQGSLSLGEGSAATASFGMPRNSAPASALASLRAEALQQAQAGRKQRRNVTSMLVLMAPGTAGAYIFLDRC